MKPRFLPLVVLSILALGVPVHAAVVDSAPAGFTLRHSVTIHGPAATAYRKFVAQIGGWWDPEHTYSGEAAHLSIAARPNGCFCEKIGPTAGITHMTVVYADPGKVLRMTGGLGPLQSMAVSAVMTLTFTKDQDDTRVEMVYTAGGYGPPGLDKLAPVVDEVLVQQMTRFERFANTGKP